MRLITLFVAWLVGYYYEPCPVCGRGVTILADGRIYSIWCSRKQHARAEARWSGTSNHSS